MRVTITHEALAQIAELPNSIRARVDDVVERLEKWPSVSGVKALTANWKGFSRIRTGDYRVIFRVGRDEITVVRVDLRRDSYSE